MITPKKKEQFINECLALLSQEISYLISQTMVDIDSALGKAIDDAVNNQAQMSALENFSIFRKQRTAIQALFKEKCSLGFQHFSNNIPLNPLLEDTFHHEVWSLVDDGILEENIVINNMTREVNNDFPDQIWQLQQRFSFLSNLPSIVEYAYPISPVQLLACLRDALKTTTLNVKGKVIIYQALGKRLQADYRKIADKANNYLITQNVLKDIDYDDFCRQQRNNYKKTENQPSIEDIAPSVSTVNGSPTAEVEVIQAEGSQIPLISAIRNLLKKARNISDDVSTVALPSRKNNSDHEYFIDDSSVTSTHEEMQHSAQKNIDNYTHNTTKNHSNITDHREIEPIVFDASMIVDAVESVQYSAATAHFISTQNNTADVVLTVPTNIAENSATIYNILQKKSPTGNIDAKNMYTIDMVGMLFEYILSDNNLPDSVKTLLSHLHTPFLKLAFLDETFFEDTEHTSRRLLDSLAEAGSQWIHHDGTAQYNMYNEIKTVVKRVVKEFEKDVNLFSELLIEFNLLKKRIEHMHGLRERNSIAKKEGQERHDSAKMAAKKALKAKIEGKNIPSAIVNILSPWFTYLTLTHLKKGEQSTEWIQGIDVIGQLLHYCSLTLDNKSSSTLKSNFERTIEDVNYGLTEVNSSNKSKQAIIDDLHLLKTNLLGKQKIKTTAPIETKNSPPETQNVEELNLDDTPTTEEERVMNYIKLIEPGTWIEYNQNTRHKITGFNSETRKYALVDQSSQEVTMLSRLQLARDILSEKVTVLDGSAKSLFERALERIRHNLDKQVQATSH